MNSHSTDQFQQRTLVTQTFTLYFPNNTLVFAAPQAASVDRAAWVETYPVEAAGTAASGTPDVSMWTVINPLSAGDSYQRDFVGQRGECRPDCAPRARLIRPRFASATCTAELTARSSATVGAADRE